MEKIVQRLVRDELRLRKKLAVLEYARECGNDTKAWREFEVPKSTFYLWKKAYVREGRAGLKRKKPVAFTHPKRVPPQVVEKVLQIRRSYQLGPERIMWYLGRYHGINISESSVYRLRCQSNVDQNGLNHKRHFCSVEPVRRGVLKWRHPR